LDRKLSGRQWQQEVIEKGKICVAVFSAVQQLSSTEKLMHKRLPLKTTYEPHTAA
jgi:hypothetical protein